jgi:hypothetical protein
MALPPISRPVSPPAASPAPRPVADARAAAQRAFFEAALGRASQAATPVEPMRQTPAAPARANTTSAAPDPNARPGSIVNIRV